MDNFELLKTIFPKTFSDLNEKVRPVSESSLLDPCLEFNNKETTQILIDILCKKPFPSWQFVSYIKNEIKLDEDIFNKVTDTVFQFTEKYQWKIFNFLANLDPPSNECMAKVVEILYEKKITLQSYLYMCLLSRENDLLLEKYLDFERSNETTYNRKTILHHAICQKVHFLEVILQDKQTNEVADDVLRNAIILSRIVSQIDLDVIYNNHPIASEVNKISSVCSDKMNNDQKTVYMDICRVRNVINVLTKLSNEKVTMSQIVESNGLLEILYKHVNLSETSYQEVHSYIEQHRSVSINDNEDLQIFSCFIIVSIVIDTVIDDGDFTSKETQSKLRFMLRQVKKNEIFIELIDSIYKLLLLRCNSTNEKQEKQNFHNLEYSDANNETVRGNYRQKYFVCSKTALYNILKFLKEIIAKRIHLKNDEEMCKKLRERLSITNQVLWKYELIEKYYEKDNCLYEVNKLNAFITSHAEARQQISSDEEASESSRDSNILRKKTRTKKRPKSLKYNRTDTNERERNEKLQSPEKDTDNIITKILITPQSLCLLCFSHTDIVEARNIIKAFSLHNTEFENEVNFLDNCEQTRRKLEPIFNKYIKQELQNTASVSTIEQIKTCANIGFEASRIINIIEKFAQTNRVKPLIEDDYLIDKYKTSFPYLEQYKANALQSTVIIDLVLNLANNYEITYNILSMIEKNYGLNSTFNSASSNQISSEHQNIGCIEFFRDLVICLQATDNNASVKDVLNNCCYTLKPAKLKHEQEKELVFDMIYSKINDSEESDLLRAYGIFFEMLDSKANYFNRFTNYLTNLSKLLNLKGKDATNATELLSVNTKNVIGELLFEHDLLPSDIENIVNTLNLNLSHLIALNFCSLAMDDAKTDTTAISKDFTSYSMQKTANNLYSYIEDQSSLLSYILQTINYQKPNLFEKLDQHFQKYVDLTDIHILSSIYNRNLRLTAIFSDYLDMNRFSTLTDKTLIKDICRIFNIEHTKNETIRSLIKDDISNVMLIELVNDINLRTKIFIEYTTKIKDYETIERLTTSIILDKNNSLLRPEYKEKLEINLKNIAIFAKVASLLELPSWFSASGSGHKTHDITMKMLLKKSEFEVAYMWSQVIGFPEYIAERRQLLNDIFLPYLHKEDAQNDVYFLKIIESFPRNLVIEFYESNFNKFKKFSLITHIVDYLDECNGQNKVELKNYKISLRILEFMSVEERENNWNLMKDPLLMLEQLIMNTKFESLARILEQVRPLLGTTICQSCFDKRKMIRNITISGTVSGLGDPNNSEFILINFLLYQRHHVITNECIDLILRIYARKSLEYSVNGTYPSTEPLSQLSVAASLDSLCDTFVMPKEAPDRTDWIRDEAASSCMCCKRANFTMLTRRHHCRRCGRVVCYSCSPHRTLIPSLYKEIPVRICRDCFVQIEASQNESANKESNSTVDCDTSKMNDIDWTLTGNLTHDKLLRQEFCYEHSPSVALCLSILCFHKDDEECVQFLLYQCRKFEKLILEFPNPEVDYALVANMLNCLALAAKFRGGPPECNTIREHSEIVNAIVKNGSQSFLPKDDLNNVTLRKLADSLVIAESWSLASDITVKCGCPATGIMAAHGLCCLKAGCFETARDKFIHCMNRLSCEHDNSAILAFIKSDMDSSEINNIPVINRPNKSPILLQEVLKIIETTCRPTQPSTLERTNVMRSSSTSLASVRSKRKENILAHEPASNILNQIATLTQITQGNYSIDSNKNVDNISSVIRNSRMFEESLYYLLMYGTHADILSFLLKHKQINCALKYFICQRVESDIFIENVFLKYLKNGKMNFLIDQMFAMDNTLSLWKDTIIQTCRFLEKKCLLNSLYQLQILLKDPIRASMTCVKFYSMNCSNFEQLHNNSYHLFNAKKHLQAELEICILEDVNFVNRKTNRTNEPSFVMRMDTKTINRHINTITRQLEVTKFLLGCERNGKSVMNILKEITLDLTTIPTLFDSVQSKIQLCILVLVCGKNIEEGFGLAYRIMQDYKLQYFKVYGITGKYLSRYNRLHDVEALINCIRSNNGHNATQLDEVIHLSIQSASNINLPENKNLIDNLVRSVKNIELKISCYIHIGHLKSAYLLAVQYDRMNDIRKILRQAEITNQVYIKRLCEKKLNIKH